jgi:Domain of unknown function (DUF3854)/Origin of replication binding protein
VKRPQHLSSTHFDSTAISLNIQSANIQPSHWQEWLDSGISPGIITANLLSLTGDEPYDYLCSAPELPRNSIGRLTPQIMRRYAHTESGGWWCNGLDPSNIDPEGKWQEMLWGCFKPDRPYLTANSKSLKYEHPVKTPTRAFFLDIPDQPQFWPKILANPTQPIIIVEGAKKAAALLSQGYAAIGLPGVFNGRRITRNAIGEVLSESLSPDLALFAQAGRPVLFCFDHDSKASTVAQVDRAIALTGRLFKQAKCQVGVISLPGPEKGVDDFLVRRGPEAFKAIYNKATTLAAWEWDIDQAQILATPPTQLVHQAKFDLNQLPIDLPTEGLFVIASAKGTGKTEAIATLVGDAEKAPLVVALGHRIALMRNVCARFELDYYNDLDQVDGAAINDEGFSHRVGLCVDSLGKIDPNKFKGAIVVIDEFMQVLRHLLQSKTCNQKGQRPALLSKFEHLLRVAKLVILADADAADIGMDYIQKLMGKATATGQHPPIHLVVNEFVPDGFAVRCSEASKEDLVVEEILADLEAGRKIFIATDSRQSSNALKDLIERIEPIAAAARITALLKAEGVTEPKPLVLVPGDGKTARRKREAAETRHRKQTQRFEERTKIITERVGRSQTGLVINSETSGLEAQRDFITHPNQTVTDYSWIIATPSLSTGVSIEVEHFDKVYGLFYGILTDADIAQSLNRVRAKVPRTIWVAERGRNFNSFSTSSKARQILTELKTNTQLNALVLKASLGCPDAIVPELFDLVWEKNPHLDIYAELVAQTNRSMWALRENVIARLLFEGNTVEIIHRDTSKGESIMQLARQRVKEQHYKAVAEARLLNPTELEAVERQEYVSPQDQLNVEKTHAAEFLACPEITPSDVAFYDKHRSSLVQLEALLYGADISVSRDLKKLTQQLKWGHGFMPFDLDNHELRRFTREKLGLLEYLDPDRVWTAEELEPLGAAVRGHRDQVKAVLGFRVPKDIKHSSNGWVFVHVCRQLGLKVESDLKRRGENGRHNEFYLNREQYNQVMTVILRRNLRRTALQTAAVQAFEPSGLELSRIAPPVINKLEGDTPDRPPIQISDRLKEKAREMVVMLKETVLQPFKLPTFQLGYS